MCNGLFWMRTSTANMQTEGCSPSMCIPKKNYLCLFFHINILCSPCDTPFGISGITVSIVTLAKILLNKGEKTDNLLLKKQNPSEETFPFLKYQVDSLTNVM